MLNAARAKAVETGVAPMFVHGDMRTFELPGQFSTIFMAGNSFLHLLTNDALRGCLEHVRRHLLGDGKFVFDVFNPAPHLLSRDYEKRYPVLRVRDPKQVRLRPKRQRNTTPRLRSMMSLGTCRRPPLRTSA